MSALVVDIETVGVGWDALDEPVQNYLIGRERRRQGPIPHEDKIAQDARSSLGLSAGTGQIVAIGLFQYKKSFKTPDNKGVAAALIASNGKESDDGKGRLVYCNDEYTMLDVFWEAAAKAGRIVTFNGRRFDGPYLMIRSLISGIIPPINLVPYRYSFKDHCDLAEVLTFFGATQSYSLDYWCRAFGIESPKGEMSGNSVAEAWAAGRVEDIGRYVLADVEATAQLYERLLPVIAMQK